MLTRNRSAEQIERFKRQFVQMDMPGIRELLNTGDLCEIIEKGIQEIPHNLRERIWTPAVTFFAFIKQKIVNGGCKDAVTFTQAELSRTGKEPCSDNTSAYCQARKELPESLLWDLVRYTGGRLEDESRMHWCCNLDYGILTGIAFKSPVRPG